MPSKHASLSRLVLEDELTRNILPFWVQHAPDHENGGFIGGLTEQLTQIDLPRSAVVTSRILWTFSQAAMRYPNPEYRTLADRAYVTLKERFMDPEYGGLYWQVDKDGVATHDQKLTYAQAFAVYGLSEYHRLTADPEVLTAAQSIHRFIETHAAEPTFGTYIEGVERDGSPKHDARLGDGMIECRKSMNTLLHVLEAYTNLLRTWPDPTLRSQHASLLKHMLTHVLDSKTGHFKLYFREDWTSLVDDFSYGHDIEGAWLLREAAHINGDPDLIRRADTGAIALAEAVLLRGVQADGSVANEGDLSGIHDRSLSWWAQAEGMVGFYDAYQLTKDDRFLRAAEGCWATIDRLFIDREFGDWRKGLLADGTLHPSSLKIGPWECPYHHARACFEMMDRLG